jgi:hypothetical protein
MPAGTRSSVEDKTSPTDVPASKAYSWKKSM